jgi:hypothetical protein
MRIACTRFPSRMFPPSEQQALAISLKVIEDILSKFTGGKYKASIKHL